MSLMDNLSQGYLPAEVAEESILVEDEVDIDTVDPDEVIFVDDVDDIIVPEEVYQEWPEGVVALEEVAGREQLELQSFTNEGDIIYEDQEYEYTEGEVPIEEIPELSEQLSIDNPIPARYLDEDGNEYTEDELVPIESPNAAEFEEQQLDPLLNKSRRKPPTIVQCEVCGVVVKHPSKIEAHMRTHTGEKPYGCEICGAKFTQRTPMLNHVRRHLGQTPFVCSYGCGKSFVNNAQKNAHELRHVGSKRLGPPRPHLKPPKRQIWNRASTENRSKQNESERTSMVDFAPPVGHIEQPISAAASKRLDEVIESVVTGVPIKKRKTRAVRPPMLVQCQVCGLMLKHASKIKAHIRTHTGDRPYVCVYCDAHFNTSGTLNMHVKRKHTSGERPFACTWDCGKRFVSLSTRNEHERVVHAGTKRYECTVPGCHRMFSRRCYLMLHRQREHGLMFKPVFDPQEIEKAEKEADLELLAEKQGKVTDGFRDQILVDPSTNMLVHVSEDGMVLEPISEHPAFMQGEFVEETEEPESAEFIKEETQRSKSPDLLLPAENTKPVQYLISDLELEPCPSGVVEVPVFEAELDEMDEVVEEQEMPALFEEHKPLKDHTTIEENSTIKPRVVNILKRKMFEEATSTVGTSNVGYVGYESPIHTTVEELEVTEESILDVEEDHEEQYNYAEDKEQRDSIYERTSIRKYRMVRRKPAQTFYCRPCNKEIKYPSKIAEHLRKHTGERPYQCQICGAGFSQGHVLKVHLRGHHGELPYKCSYCPHSFQSLALKKQHEKTHYQPEVKDDPPIDTIVIQEGVEAETEAIVDTAHAGEVAVDSHVYACPIVECGMQSQSKEEVEEHIAVVHGEMQEWIEEGGEPEVYEDGTMVVNAAEEGQEQEIAAEQHSIMVADDQQYGYYPYDEETMVMEGQPVDTIELQRPPVTLDNAIPREAPAQNFPNEPLRIYEHYTYVDDPNVPPPTEEIEIETSEQHYMLDARNPTNIPLQRTIVYDNIVSSDDIFDINLAEDIPVEDRVRVLIDPKPPKKGRLTCDEYYDRMINKNMQEMEVDAAMIEMAAPLRHVRLMTEEGPVVIAQPSGRMRRNRLIRSQSDKQHGARNLDWIIDAVARGLDVDSASPHNRRKPVMHKCQYCGRIDKYPSKIKAHMRTHTGEKPFKCEICGMTFAQRTPMRLHVRRHLDQKPYICNIEGCDLRFVSGALLNYHQQTKHFMTKRYICLKGCGRFFASARNQRNHEARCFYNTEQANDFGDAIYEHLVYNDQEEEEASENEVEEELEEALEAVETSLNGSDTKVQETETQPQFLHQ
ncbi:hypothetical protein RB195_004381 [Necator americanus]|uniref:C2H2-type domain-containing protein n=1 Tax=Necator americanus TaxID=51031 RepID=A0ABR1BM85_NECAM